jgi:hypothetical protein
VTASTPARMSRLRTLNAMLSGLVGSGPHLRRDVDAVVQMFEADEQSSVGLDARALAGAATQMLKLLSPDQILPAIAVLDHREETFEPLWAADRLGEALEQVGEAPDVLLWVVGLHDQFLAGSKARSVKSRQAYDEAIDVINLMAARLQGRRRITVVVL